MPTPGSIPAHDALIVRTPGSVPAHDALIVPQLKICVFYLSRYAFYKREPFDAVIWLLFLVNFGPLLLIYKLYI